MPRPDIRELRTEELHACVRLLRQAFATVATEFGLTEDTAPTNAAFTTLENLQRHMRDGMVLFGLFIDGTLLGCVALKRAKGNDGIFYIERLAVAPESRHRGHGGALLSFAMEEIRARGGAVASIGLIDDNSQLKEWYRSKGFVQHDCRRVGHLPFKVCFMSRGLVDAPSSRSPS